MPSIVKWNSLLPAADSPKVSRGDIVIVGADCRCLIIHKEYERGALLVLNGFSSFGLHQWNETFPLTSETTLETIRDCYGFTGMTYLGPASITIDFDRETTS